MLPPSTIETRTAADPLLSDRMRLIQPQLPDVVGKQGFREGRPVTLRTIDKVTLRNGVAVERVANLDSRIGR